MAPHSSTLAWKIPWAEEPDRLQSMGLWRVGHDWETSLSLSLSCIGEGNGNPLQCYCLENPMDGGAWWAAVCGVAQSRTWLKRLSSILFITCFFQSRIAEKRKEVKGKGEKKRYTHLIAEFRRIARRHKKAFLSDQCKETKENNRMGKTRDLLRKLETPREHFMERWEQ